MATARRDNKNRHQHSNHNHNNQNDSGDSFEEESTNQESQEFDSSENSDPRSRKRKRGGYEGPAPAPIDLVELKKKAISDLIEVAKGLGVENTGGLKKQNLIFAIFTSASGKRRTSPRRRGYGKTSGRIWIFTFSGLQLRAGSG